MLSLKLFGGGEADWLNLYVCMHVVQLRVHQIVCFVWEGTQRNWISIQEKIPWRGMWEVERKEAAGRTGQPLSCGERCDGL